MKLSWATDIHLNFVSDEDVRKFRREIAAQSPKAVLLGGDIAEADSLEKYLLLLGGTLGVPIYFVLGNHDFYRGRISPVRDAMKQLTRKDPSRFGYLPAAGVIALTEKTALVGVDGWGDARIGSYNNSPVELNDWVHIDDLRFLDKPTRLGKLRALGDESADQLRKLLDEALRKFSRVVVLTHVPPFKETCWHDGKLSDDDWLPWFTCRAVGDVLAAAAERNSDKRIDVYCGHTHGGGTAQIRPNLAVHTGAAEYGKPMTQNVIEVQ
jgi:predicted MPP superfamily phosphohydrolase